MAHNMLTLEQIEQLAEITYQKFDGLGFDENHKIIFIKAFTLGGLCVEGKRLDQVIEELKQEKNEGNN